MSIPLQVFHPSRDDDRQGAAGSPPPRQTGDTTQIRRRLVEIAEGVKIFEFAPADFRFLRGNQGLRSCDPSAQGS